MSVDPYEPPRRETDQVIQRNPLVGYVVAGFGCCAFVSGMVAFVRLLDALQSPALNSSSTWSFASKLLAPAFALCVCGLCLLRAAERHNKNGNWVRWLAGPVVMIGLICAVVSQF